MLPAPHNLYHELRMRSGLGRALREITDSPPERLLQAIWQHQRLKRDELKTADGRRVNVLHPGFWNLEGGPDFRQALIQIADGPLMQGDIEIDLRPSGWRAHGHYKNPAFKTVILHVVWQTDGAFTEDLPQLPLKPVLDSPPGELSLWLNAEGTRELPAELRGKCCAPLAQMDQGTVRVLLIEAAEVRLASKGNWFAARARQAGWEQGLWEGLFRALGYKHNAWPMQRIAELRPRWIASTNNNPVEFQARLLGISGMLPSDFRPGRTEMPFARSLWDSWWRERDQFADCILPREAWRLHGLRPANHPQRRLALAAHWCSRPALPKNLEQWCAAEIPKTSLPASLASILQAPDDDFWSWHWTFRSARMARPQPLLGQTRVTDIAINVVLPWLAVRAAEGRNQKLLDTIRRRYFEWPAAEDNSVLKLARQRLFGGASRKLFATASSQQGLMQIVRDFCDHSNSVCDKCRLPEMTQEYTQKHVSWRNHPGLRTQESTS